MGRISDVYTRERGTASMSDPKSSDGIDAAVSHGRHCPCSPCAREDWAKIDAPCGMHGADCPREYLPLGSPFNDREPDDYSDHPDHPDNRSAAIRQERP